MIFGFICRMRCVVKGMNHYPRKNAGTARKKEGEIAARLWDHDLITYSLFYREGMFILETSLKILDFKNIPTM